MPAEAGSWLAIIPARGGSSGVRAKNLRTVGGLPLVVRAIDRAANVPAVGSIVVATDDPDTAALAEVYGAAVHRTSGFLAGPDATVAQVAADVCASGAFDVGAGFVILQPTSPLLAADDVAFMLDEVVDRGLDSAATVRSERHLAWTADGPIWPAPANRQRLDDRLWIETGGAQAVAGGFPARGGRSSGWPLVGASHHLYEVDGPGAFDVDSPADLVLANQAAADLRRHHRPQVHFVVAAGHHIGTGHVRRCLVLADGVSDRCDVTFGFDERSESAWAEALIRARGYDLPPVEATAADVVVVDALDGSPALLHHLADSGVPVVALEASGVLANLAAVTVNELLPPRGDARSGPHWAVLPPALEAASRLLRTSWPSSPTVLVTFGGTDPGGLTGHVLDALAPLASAGAIHLAWAHPPASTASPTPHPVAGAHVDPEVPFWRHLLDADIVVTSAGRTVNEAAAAGALIISTPVNAREAQHLVTPGTLRLPYAQTLPPSTFPDAVLRLLDDPHSRAWMGYTAADAVGSGGRQPLIDAIVDLAER